MRFSMPLELLGMGMRIGFVTWSDTARIHIFTVSFVRFLHSPTRSHAQLKDAKLIRWTNAIFHANGTIGQWNANGLCNMVGYSTYPHFHGFVYSFFAFSYTFTRAVKRCQYKTWTNAIFHANGTIGHRKAIVMIGFIIELPEAVNT